MFACSVEDPHSWHTSGVKYDFISCLNVLDRCSHPLSMLRQISDNLQPGKLLILVMCSELALCSVVLFATIISKAISKQALLGLEKAELGFG